MASKLRKLAEIIDEIKEGWEEGGRECDEKLKKKKKHGKKKKNKSKKEGKSDNEHEE